MFFRHYKKDANSLIPHKSPDILHLGVEPAFGVKQQT